jgi:hypothetical protein
VIDYGRSNWSGRSLETEVIRVRVKLTNADAGAYHDFRVDLAFQNNPEIQRIGFSQSFSCDASAG